MSDQLDLMTGALTVAEEFVVGDDLKAAVEMRDAIMAMERKMAQTRMHLERNIAMALPADSVRVHGVGQVRREKKYSTSQLELGKEQLLADVLDSRIFDPRTGELIEETPLQKVLACWNLSVSGIRDTEMKKRGLKYRDYAETTDAGWKISITREGPR